MAGAAADPATGAQGGTERLITGFMGVGFRESEEGETQKLIKKINFFS